MINNAKSDDLIPYDDKKSDDLIPYDNNDNGGGSLNFISIFMLLGMALLRKR
ncbi:GlyGly-CTERM sorting domain-containing protein [Photobacterium leiognathi]|uniref:GlyGly-CTERM sorting domain-containing protein n=1 Tax=Photobacterium leiognathi TaxID=553611 RepID=UPI0034E38DEA